MSLADPQDKTPIGGVPIQHLLAVWPKVTGLLNRVVKPISGHTLDTLLTELQGGAMQLWVIGDFQGVVVTAVVDRPIQRILWTQFLAGDHMSEWLDDWINVQEEYALQMNCAAVEFSGRRGWHKIGEKHTAYKPVFTTFRRELDGRK